jgi:hypothetical protein
MRKALVSALVLSALAVAAAPLRGQARFGYGFNPSGFYGDQARGYATSEYQNSRYGFGASRYGHSESRYGFNNTRFGAQYSPYGGQVSSYGIQYNMYGGGIPGVWSPINPEFDLTHNPVWPATEMSAAKAQELAAARVAPRTPDAPARPTAPLAPATRPASPASKAEPRAATQPSAPH